MQKYGFDATFFVLIEVTNQGEAEYLTWDMMREMHAAGMDIECHARVHENLPENDDARLIWQVLGCREAIESELGQRPRFVAYPSGRFDERVAAFFASDNYWGGITTQQGTPAQLRRPLRDQTPARAQHHDGGRSWRSCWRSRNSGRAGGEVQVSGADARCQVSSAEVSGVECQVWGECRVQVSSDGCGSVK